LAKKGRGTPPRATKKKATTRKGSAPRSTARTASKAKARPASRASKPAPRKPVQARPQAVPPPAPQPAAPPPPPRKPGFYEAVAIYERGVQALQRHDFQAAAENFRAVIQRYPEERELLERARLYLRVCERETARQAPPPQTSGDHVYAATVALNAGDHAGALSHLQRAIGADADNDHAHYIMAVALASKGRRDEAIEHLKRSIALNPENRAQARQDPDLDPLREHDGFRSAMETPSLPRRKAVAVRRR
jgi:tetratricopeptide (TPR) repeat protein